MLDLIGGRSGARATTGRAQDSHRVIAKAPTEFNAAGILVVAKQAGLRKGTGYSTLDGLLKDKTIARIDGGRYRKGESA